MSCSVRAHGGVGALPGVAVGLRLPRMCQELLRPSVRDVLLWLRRSMGTPAVRVVASVVGGDARSSLVPSYETDILCGEPWRSVVRRLFKSLEVSSSCLFSYVAGVCE